MSGAIPPGHVDPALTTRAAPGSYTPDMLTRAARLGAATLHEASGRKGALPHAIRAVHPQFRIAGRAVTVDSPGADNLWIHRAIYAAQPGDVLVVTVSGVRGYGYWGEVMSTAAKVRGLAGLVIDGCVRDSDLLAEIGFPVFAAGLSIRGTGKDFGAMGWINHALPVGDMVVMAGDLIVADADGVVAVARDSADAVMARGEERAAYEEDICRRLEGGATTLELFGWAR